MLFNYFLLSLFFITGASAEENTQPAKNSSLDMQLKSLDQQIAGLANQIDNYRHQAIDAEAAAQKVRIYDFQAYIDKVKEVQKFNELSRSTDAKMKHLEEDRLTLIQDQPAAQAK